MTTIPFNLTTGENTINLAGRLVDHSGDVQALALLSELFTGYIKGEALPTIAQGVSATLPDGQQIDWISRGIKALKLQVPLQSPTGPIGPIKSITIGAFNLVYDPAAPYAPTASSDTLSAGVGLPFGFSLNITNVQNSITIIANNTAIANVTAPTGTGNVRIDSRNAGYTTGTLFLSLPASPLIVGNSYTDHLVLDQFQYDLVTTNGSKFFLGGLTNAITATPIGAVTLTGLPFLVPAGLIGLQNLKARPTTIDSVDVTGGTSQYIELAITGMDVFLAVISAVSCFTDSALRLT
jgi:hypothetical protein